MATESTCELFVDIWVEEVRLLAPEVPDRAYELFPAQGIQDYECFLRLRIAKLEFGHLRSRDNYG